MTARLYKPRHGAKNPNGWPIWPIVEALPDEKPGPDGLTHVEVQNTIDVGWISMPKETFDAIYEPMQLNVWGWGT